MNFYNDKSFWFIEDDEFGKKTDVLSYAPDTRFVDFQQKNIKRWVLIHKNEMDHSLSKDFWFIRINSDPLFVFNIHVRISCFYNDVKVLYIQNIYIIRLLVPKIAARWRLMLAQQLAMSVTRLQCIWGLPIYSYT